MSSQLMDAIVIGCGASGIAALTKLHEAGLKVMGVEASDRIGGRICTVKYDDGLVDLGASWCHGEKNNAVYDLANPLGLLEVSPEHHKFYLQSNGEKIAEETAQQIAKTLQDIISKADKNNCDSVSDCLRNGIKACTELEDQSGLFDGFVEWFERTNHVGGQTDRAHAKSLKGLVKFVEYVGEHLHNWKGKGYKTILDVLLKKIPDPTQEIPVQILLNKEVEMIKWNPIEPEFERDDPLVHVMCKDGSLYATKRVIVTFSLGVLKEKYNGIFSPPLPATKVEAINSLQMGLVDKIYIDFEEPWWPSDKEQFEIIWRQEDKDKFSGEEKWISEVYGLMTVEHHRNLLIAWVYGEGAKTMEKASLNNIKIGVIKLLHLLFSKEFKLTPVKSVLRSQWSSNHLTRGSYSYRSVASDQNCSGAVELSEPLYHRKIIPVVCFGGEASSHEQHGSVHGAVEAGLREAARIIESFK